jgi:hypothetical protein
MQLIDRLATQINGGDPALLANVGAAIAALDPVDAHAKGKAA